MVFHVLYRLYLGRENVHLHKCNKRYSKNGIKILPDPPAWQECWLLWKLLKLPEQDPCKHGHKQVKTNMTVQCKVCKKEEQNLWRCTDPSDMHTKGRTLSWFLPLTIPQQNWGSNDAVSQCSSCSTAPWNSQTSLVASLPFSVRSTLIIYLSMHKPSNLP